MITIMKDYTQAMIESTKLNVVLRVGLRVIEDYKHGRILNIIHY